jgi:hypothetical protein
MVEHERHHIFIFSYLLYEILMYKLGTLIYEYSFVFSLWVGTNVSIKYLPIQNLGKEISTNGK